MSAAQGIQAVITNNGKQDQILLANDLLQNRLNFIATTRANDARYAGKYAGATYSDVEQTHLLFVKSTLRPFVTFGLEYSPFAAQSAPNWGSKLSFIIQQTGDFFTDMAVQTTVTPPTFTGGVVSVPTLTTNTASGFTGSSQLLTPAQNVLSSYNAAFGANTGAIYPQASPAGIATSLTQYAVPTNAALPAVTFQWIDYPGEAIFTLYEFVINGSTIDSYPYQKYQFLRNLAVSQDKITAYKRLMGQQVEKVGTLGQSSLPTTSNTVSASPDACQMHVSVTDGPQTPVAITGTLPTLNMFIPIHFWFCENSRSSIPSAAVSQGQRFINLTITSAASNLYYINVPSPATNPNIPLGTTYSAVSVSSQATINALIYVCNIYIDPTVANIFVETVGFNLVRLHVYQPCAGVSSGSQQLTSFKWPTEYVLFGFKPPAALNPPQLTSPHDWGNFTLVTRQKLNMPGVMPMYGGYTTSEFAAPVASSGGGTPVITTVSPVLPGYNAGAPVGVPVYVPKYQQIVSNLGVSTNGSDLWNKNSPSILYNSYVPYHYSPSKLCAPIDSGIFFVTFCLEPLVNQPTGYFNVSRVKDFTVNFTLNPTYVSSYSMADLYSLGSCLNFSVIAEGNMIIRYSN